MRAANFYVNAAYLILFSLCCVVFLVACVSDWLHNKAMMSADEKEEVMREAEVAEEDRTP